LYERNARFHEHVVHIGRAVDADRRTARARQQALRLQVVRRVLQLVAAILHAERDLDRLVRPRQLGTDRAEVAGDDALSDVLIDRAGLDAGSLDVVQRRLVDAALREHVVWNATRIGAVDH
jgi:hypothetical protein